MASTLKPVTSSYSDAQLARIDAALVAEGKAATRQTRAKKQHDLLLAWAKPVVVPEPTPDPVPDPTPDPTSPIPGMKLVWSDEFDGDLSKWNVQDNSTFGDGNGEEERYMAANTAIRNGNLQLTAKQETTSGHQYTSGMVTTRAQGGPEKFSFTHGYVEARIKMPKGGGYWPAFWLVGDQHAPGWPAYGEFDIVEQYGTHPEYYEATTHWKNASGSNKQEGGSAIKYASGSATDFHTYGLLWEPGKLTYYLDGKPVQTFTPKDAGAQAALGYGHTIILNLAVGGTGPSDYHGWNGSFAAGEVPGVMEVEYVRVYQAA